jgi:DNA recombination protein RmuC
MVMAMVLMMLLGLALGSVLGALWVRSRPAYVGQVLDAGVDRAELLLGLDRLSDQMRDLDHQRASWQGQLSEQVLDMRLAADGLRRETQSLSTALRKPQVRGRWGEMHLRRAVELAGLVDRCDFTEQAHTRTSDDAAQRPDLVVHLVGGRSVVVDAKVPLDAFLDATSTDDEEEREAHLARHARQLRQHVEALAAKRYWRSLRGSPEFVVLFVPAESFLAAALTADRDLLEDAAARQVVLATPTTLIALLRTVALGWRQEALAGRADQIHRLGRDLHERLTTMTAHLDNVGRSLNATVGHYNAAMGSLESRVLVSARRFQDLAVTDDDLPAPRSVVSLARRAVPDEEVEPPSLAL